MSGKTVTMTGLRWAVQALVAMLSISVAGCLPEEDKVAKETTNDTGTVTPPPITPSPTNRAPTISGTPVKTAKVSLAYAFQPSATDPDGDKLSFEVLAKPDWATFSKATGKLSGTPPDGSTGTFTGIQITVSDGKATTALAPFSINVLEPVVGSAELAWQPPTENEDGTALVNLSGYVIRYGKAAGVLDKSLRIDNPGTTMYVVDNLIEGIWYFSLSSVNAAGVESRQTGYVSKTIS